MSDCDQCQFYIGPSGGVHHGCGHEEMPLVVFLDCMTGANCEHWYPNGREYAYDKHLKIWEHPCDQRPYSGKLVMWGGPRLLPCWRLWAEDYHIAFCPYCGLELQPMPEVKE